MAVEDDLWVHQKFGYAIPRRNGKTEIVYMMEIWALEKGLNVLHTAHRISTSPDKSRVLGSERPLQIVDVHFYRIKKYFFTVLLDF